MKKFYMYTVSSMEKVFPNERPLLYESENSMFKNERFNFQAVCYADERARFVKFKIESKLADIISCRIVEYAPSMLTQYQGLDDYVLKRESGIFPDILRDISERDIHLRDKQWTAFWLTLDGRGKDIETGVYDIKLIIQDANGEELCSAVYELKVMDGNLADSDIVYTNWMHYDCIANEHNVKLFGDDFYAVFKNYLNSVVTHGMTMLYTPLFTPPLDTAVGGERMTAQLVDIEIVNKKYVFNFDKLDSFIDFALARGIRYIEFSHLYTQWGAECCPKIMAAENGRQVKLFGWENSSGSLEYREFLSVFLPRLVGYVEKKGIKDIVYFHLSDEPSESHSDWYRECKAELKKYLAGFRIIDAMSSYELFKNGGPDIPIVHLGAEEDFFKNEVDFWVYYCCSSGAYLTNRYFSMPSQRTRILGIQLYLNNIHGFLQWGFNFYNSALSRRRINPYIVTDADGGFPSGDAYIVYPNGGGVIESLRHEVFFDGFQDYMALKTLEEIEGREFVVRLIREQGVDGFTEYPKSALWHSNFRKRINRLIGFKNK